MVQAPFDDSSMDNMMEQMIDSEGPGASHKQIRTFGKTLSVVAFEDQEYLIGVQIATLLKRETFNMYRSMKIKNINIQRATPEQVEFLCKCKAVRAGTHSVTLIPYESGLTLASDALRRKTGGSKHPVGKRRAAKKKVTETVDEEAVDEDDEDDESYDEYQPRSSSSRSKTSWGVRRSSRKPQWCADYTEAHDDDEATETTEYEESRSERPQSKKSSGASKVIKKSKKNSRRKSTLSDLVKIIFEPAFLNDLEEATTRKSTPQVTQQAELAAPSVSANMEVQAEHQSPEKAQAFQQYHPCGSMYPPFVPFVGANSGCATIVPRYPQMPTNEHMPQAVLHQPIC